MATLERTQTIQERILQAQLGQFQQERRRYAEALRFYTGKDDWEALKQYEALLQSVAWQIAKDKGYSSLEEAIPEAQEVLGVQK